MAKKKTAKKAAKKKEFRVSSAFEERPFREEFERSGRSASTNVDPQSIASALSAAIGLIKAAGGVDRAIQFIDDVETLIEVCGSAEIARQTLQACRGVLELKARGQADDAGASGDGDAADDEG
jgi:hypothetical protein